VKAKTTIPPSPKRRARDEKDLEIIRRNAERLNRQALDTLEYQRLP
jgi:hypothetical protein